MVPQILLALALLACAPRVFAARSMLISGNTSSLSDDNILVVTASPSGFLDGEIVFIKGAFFQSGTSNYFGYTKHNDVWVKNSASNSTQRSVKIGEWDGTLETKVDYGDSGYKGENDYAFKLRFYYGAAFSADWSTNELTISISEPDPTITPIPTSTAIPTQTRTPTQVPSSTPQPTVYTISPTIFSTRANSSVAGLATSSGMHSGSVLGGMNDDFENDTVATDTVQKLDKSTNNLRALSVALAFIASGFALLSTVTIWHNIKVWTADTQRKKQ